MLLEMAAEGEPERIVVGSHDDGITAAELLERSRAPPSTSSRVVQSPSAISA